MDLWGFPTFSLRYAYRHRDSGKCISKGTCALHAVTINQTFSMVRTFTHV